MIGSLNITSVRNIFDTVDFIFKNGYTDLLALCETKIDESFPLLLGYHNHVHDADYTILSSPLCRLI